MYDSKAVLPLVYDVGKNGDLNPLTEKALLDQARRIEIERKHDEAMGVLVNAEEVNRIWTNHIVNARTKLLAISAKLAPTVAEINDKNKVKAEIDRLIYEVLEDLSNNEGSDDAE